MEETHQNIEEARKLWMESMYEDGNEIPLPGTETEKQYSGKFNVRIPKSLHRKLDEMAEKEGVSLNHYLVSTLSRAVGQGEAIKSKSHRKHAAYYKSKRIVAKTRVSPRESELDKVLCRRLM